MRLQLNSGVILTTNNESLIQQYLKYGAVEYKESVKKTPTIENDTEQVVGETVKKTVARKKAVK